MIDLFDQEIYQDNRKSSKGNQLKWQKKALGTKPTIVAMKD